MLRMKLILLLLVSFLYLQNGTGAPQTAVYKFLTCKPGGDQANCVTQRAELPWSPDLPAKLPASVGQHLNAKPDEDESPPSEEDNEVVNDVETPMSEDKESHDLFVGDEGSGEYEGSASWISAAGRKTGSGKFWEDRLLNKGGRFFSNNFPVGESKPTEQDLKDEHLLTP